MLEAFIRSMLGTAGSAVLDYYIEHAVIINTLIFIYFGLILLGRKSYQNMKQALKAELEKASNKTLANRSEKWFQDLLEKQKIDWKSVGQSSSIPFYSPENFFWFFLKNEKSIRKQFSPKRVSAWYQAINEQPSFSPEGEK